MDHDLTSLRDALPGRILLVGCGRMGLALLRGWIARGVPADAIGVIDPDPSPEVADTLSGLGVTRTDAREAGQAGVLVLAVKPQVFPGAAASLAQAAGPDTVVLSIMAGITIAELSSSFPSTRSVIRAMPNLAAMAGEGASVFVADERSSEAAVGVAEALLAAVGMAARLPGEELVDAATAVSGSGPAYVFYLVECLAAAGVRQGLPPEIAARLARATVQGAGAVLGSSPEEPDALRQQVTSPGGTTQAGLAVLMRDQGLQPLVDETVAAAARRARELGSRKG
jgi:pyrroline-5-carboxylate reductase